MSKIIEDHHASYVRSYLEENWSDFVDYLEENYGEDAEGVAEEIVNKLA